MQFAQVWRIDNSDPISKLSEIEFNSDSSTVDSISNHFPDGVYTTFRTFQHNKVLPLEDQFQRLEESACLLKLPILLNRELIRLVLKKVTRYFHEDDLRIRLTIDLTHQFGMIYISIEPLIVPQFLDYEDGVNTLTRSLERTDPKAKQTAFLHTSETLRRRLPENINEILLVNREGQILEGLSSNFFCYKRRRNLDRRRKSIIGYYPVNNLR